MNPLTLRRVAIDYSEKELASVDPDISVRNGMDELELPDLRNAKIAVASGSRGVACSVAVIKALVDALRGRGALPFIVPAMGSHGGATAEGQKAVLAGYGITESAVGAPIRSSMETLELDSTGIESRIFVDRNAWEADYVVPVNRIKAHTDFISTHESGLAKMLVVGLGKHDQAKEQHSYGIRGLRDLLVPAARRIIESGKVLYGIAIVENVRKDPSVVELIPPEKMISREAELLALAKRLTPKLPADTFDLLIVDEMGKDKSGTGLDTNVIGRRFLPGEEEPKLPDIAIVVVRRLSHASHGNALGVGLADIVLRELADSIDFPATYENIATSSFLERGKLPVVAESDAEALFYAARALHVDDGFGIGAMHIDSTLDLERVGLTDPLFESVLASGRCTDLNRTYNYPGS